MVLLEILGGKDAVFLPKSGRFRLEDLTGQQIGDYP